MIDDKTKVDQLRKMADAWANLKAARDVMNNIASSKAETAEAEANIDAIAKTIDDMQRTYGS